MRLGGLRRRARKPVHRRARRSLGDVAADPGTGRCFRAGPKGGRLLSLMGRIVERPTILVVVLLTLLFAAGGCGGPESQADEVMATTSEAVQRHNELYQEARSSYDDAREALDAGEDPEGQVERIGQARETLLEARASLEDARENLSGIGDLEVERQVKDYAELLSEAMGAQIEAENREAEFYEILEADPILENDREQALDVLAQVGEGYDEADRSYARARELAEANPELLSAG